MRLGRTLRPRVFGRPMQVVATAEGWRAYYPGSVGKRRPAREVVIPPDVAERDLARYLGDICHEWASSLHPDVVVEE